MGEVPDRNFNFKKLPVSGGIENDILMPPETGNFSWFTSKLPVSGGIKMSFSM